MSSVVSSEGGVNVELPLLGCGDIVRMNGKVSSGSEDLRWAFNLCKDDFQNCLLHLVFTRTSRTSNILVTSSYEGKWLGSPGWSLSIPPGLDEDFELKVLIKEDGMDILFNDVPIPAYNNHGDCSCGVFDIITLICLCRC
mmetsp:Transcript_2629/g.3202  ORF Transcript_2629/g.3202 Transcript_2629/m.3202 type:complete len:140 (-) Transcript_2629:234-653(-)